MSSFGYVVYFLVKEMVQPRLHHKNAVELIGDVEIDVFRKTHNYDHSKYIQGLYEFVGGRNEQRD